MSDFDLFSDLQDVAPAAVPVASAPGPAADFDLFADLAGETAPVAVAPETPADDSVWSIHGPRGVVEGAKQAGRDVANIYGGMAARGGGGLSNLGSFAKGFVGDGLNAIGVENTWPQEAKEERLANDQVMDYINTEAFPVTSAVGDLTRGAVDSTVMTAPFIVAGPLSLAARVGMAAKQGAPVAPAAIKAGIDTLGKIMPAALGMQAFGDQYGKKRSQDVEPLPSLLSAGVTGAAEYGFERVSTDSLLNVITGGADNFVANLGKYFGKEIITELPTTVVQTLADLVFDKDVTPLQAAERGARYLDIFRNQVVETSSGEDHQIIPELLTTAGQATIQVGMTGAGGRVAGMAWDALAKKPANPTGGAPVDPDSAPLLSPEHEAFDALQEMPEPRGPWARAAAQVVPAVPVADPLAPGQDLPSMLLNDSFEEDSLSGSALSGFGVTADTPDFVNGETLLGDSTPQGTSGDADFLGNIIGSQPFLEQGFNGLDIETQAGVMAAMGRASQDPEILNSIVKFIPVDVVNSLARQKLTPQMLFHDPSMLKDILSGNGDPGITPSRNTADSVVRALVLATTEKATRLARGNLSARSNNFNTTMGADTNSHNIPFRRDNAVTIQQNSELHQENMTDPYSMPALGVRMAELTGDAQSPETTALVEEFLRNKGNWPNLAPAYRERLLNDFVTRKKAERGPVEDSPIDLTEEIQTSPAPQPAGGRQAWEMEESEALSLIDEVKKVPGVSSYSGIGDISLSDKADLDAIEALNPSISVTVKDTNGARRTFTIKEFNRLSKNPAFSDRVRGALIGVDNADQKNKERAQYFENRDGVPYTFMDVPSSDWQTKNNPLLGDGAPIEPSPVEMIDGVELENNSSVRRDKQERFNDALRHPIIRENLKRLGIKRVSIEAPHKFQLSEQGNISIKKKHIQLSADAMDPTSTLLHEIGHDVYRSQFTDTQRTKWEREYKKIDHEDLEGYQKLGLHEEVFAEVYSQIDYSWAQNILAEYNLTPPATTGQTDVQTTTALEAKTPVTYPALKQAAARLGLTVAAKNKQGLFVVTNAEKKVLGQMQSLDEVANLLEGWQAADATPALPAPKAKTAKQLAAQKVRSTVNPASDDLLMAIRKLGGLDKAQALEQWGKSAIESDYLSRSPLPGKPVLRNKAGLPLDRMLTTLKGHGYLAEDATLRDFEDLFLRAAGGETILTNQGDERAADALYKAEMARMLGEMESARAQELVEEIDPDFASLIAGAPELEGMTPEALEWTTDVFNDILDGGFLMTADDYLRSILEESDNEGNYTGRSTGAVAQAAASTESQGNRAAATGIDAETPAAGVRSEVTPAGDQLKMFATPPTFGKKAQPTGDGVASLDLSLAPEAAGLFDVAPPVTETVAPKKRNAIRSARIKNLENKLENGQLQPGNMAELNRLQEEMTEKRAASANRYMQKDAGRFKAAPTPDDAGVALYDITSALPLALKELGKLVQAGKESLPHLITVGRAVHARGVADYRAFVAGMKAELGALFERFKGQMLRAWHGVLAKLKEERGSFSNRPVGLGRALKTMMDDLKGSPYNQKDVVPIELSGGFDEDNGRAGAGIRSAATKGDGERQLFSALSYGNSAVELGEAAHAVARQIASGEISKTEALQAFANSVQHISQTTPDGALILRDIAAHLRTLGHDIPNAGLPAIQGLFKAIGAAWQQAQRTDSRYSTTRQTIMTGDSGLGKVTVTPAKSLPFIGKLLAKENAAQVVVKGGNVEAIREILRGYGKTPIFFRNDSAVDVVGREAGSVRLQPGGVGSDPDTRRAGGGAILSANEIISGFVHPAQPNLVFLNVDAPNHLLFIIGHEIGHAIQMQDAALWAEMEAELAPLIRNWSHYRDRMPGQYKSLNENEKQEELLDDIIGHHFLNDQFWSELAQANRTIFTRIAKKAIELLNKALRLLTGKDVGFYVSDMTQARAIIAKTLLKYGENVNKGMYGKWAEQADLETLDSRLMGQTVLEHLRADGISEEKINAVLGLSSAKWAVATKGKSLTPKELVALLKRLGLDPLAVELPADFTVSDSFDLLPNDLQRNIIVDAANAYTLRKADPKAAKEQADARKRYADDLGRIAREQSAIAIPLSRSERASGSEDTRPPVDAALRSDLRRGEVEAVFDEIVTFNLTATPESFNDFLDLYRKTPAGIAEINALIQAAKKLGYPVTGVESLRHALQSEIILESPDGAETKYQIEKAIEQLDPRNVLEKVRDFMNPLDWSRLRSRAEKRTSLANQHRISYMLMDPFFKQSKTDPAAKPFYQEGQRREVERSDYNILLRGGLVESGERKTVWQETKEKQYNPLSAWEMKALDVLVVEGEARHVEYTSLTKALQNPAIKAAGVNEAVFTFYRSLLKAKELAANAQLDAERAIMEEAGMTPEKVKESIAARREAGKARVEFSFQETGGRLVASTTKGSVNVVHQLKRIAKEMDAEFTQSEDDTLTITFKKGQIEAGKEALWHVTANRIPGHIHRDHGDGEHVVFIHQIIRSLDFDISTINRKDGKEGSMFFLPYYPGKVLTDKIEEVADELGASFLLQEGSGRVILTIRKDVAKVLQKKLAEIPLTGKSGKPYKVMVYRRHVDHETAATKLKKEVSSDYKSALPFNYRPDLEYEASWGISTSLQEPEYQALVTSSAAQDHLIEEALKKAKNSGALTEKEYAISLDASREEIANQLLARGAGATMIRRVPYVIEGYDRENMVGNFERQIDGTAGMLSKSTYAMRQLKHMKTVPAETRRWAMSYIEGTLRNMTRFDQLNGDIRGVTAFLFMGFSVSWALVNHTQPYIVGIAQLSRRIKNGDLFLPNGEKGATMQVLTAQKDLIASWTKDMGSRLAQRILPEEMASFATRWIPSGLSAEERALFRDSRVRVQLEETVLGEMSGSDATLGGKISSEIHNVTRISLAHGNWIEVINRKMMILAAYRTLKAQKMSDEKAMEGALEVNAETNIEQGRHNLPLLFSHHSWARTGMALSSYIRHMLQTLYFHMSSGSRADQKAVLRMLFAMTLLGGVPAGWIGSDDLDEMIMKIWGYSPKQALKSYLRKKGKTFENVGDLITGIFWRGVPDLAGVSMTGAVALRTPVVSAINSGTDVGMAFGGAPAAYVDKLFKAVDSASRGDFYRAGEHVGPLAFSRGMGAYRLATEGVTTSRGRKVYYQGQPLKLEPAEAVLRAVGIQPARFAEVNEFSFYMMDMERIWKERRSDALDYYRETGKMNKVWAYNKKVLGNELALQLAGQIDGKALQRALKDNPAKKKAMVQQAFGPER